MRNINQISLAWTIWHFISGKIYIIKYLSLRLPNYFTKEDTASTNPEYKNLKDRRMFSSKISLVTFSLCPIKTYVTFWVCLAFSLIYIYWVQNVLNTSKRSNNLRFLRFEVPLRFELGNIFQIWNSNYLPVKANLK